MKLRTSRVFMLTLITATAFISCKKDLIRHKFEMRTETFYRISPTAPTTIAVNGTEYVASAYFPGAGTGTATYMGSIVFYFNQLTYAVSAGAPPAGSVAAPVIDILTYPVTGAPLPLIQQGDFTQLSALVTSLQIPAEAYEQIVNGVLVGKNGDAVFTSAITGSGSTFPISQTRIGFNGKALITGGRGKFKRAVGEIDYEGSFNINDPNDADYNAHGWINY
jgi:hypothetical protein